VHTSSSYHTALSLVKIFGGSIVSAALGAAYCKVHEEFILWKLRSGVTQDVEDNKNTLTGKLRGALDSVELPPWLTYRIIIDDETLERVKAQHPHLKIAPSQEVPKKE